MTIEKALDVNSNHPTLKSAINSVKEAIPHFLLIEFNHPHESAIFIPILQQGIEQLLSYWFELQGQEPPKYGVLPKK